MRIFQAASAVNFCFGYNRLRICLGNLRDATIKAALRRLIALVVLGLPCASSCRPVTCRHRSARAVLS